MGRTHRQKEEVAAEASRDKGQDNLHLGKQRMEYSQVSMDKLEAILAVTGSTRDALERNIDTLMSM